MYDYLIVGQGLAGSLLAFRLIRSGHKVVVVDNNHRTSSSAVAAGLYNPVIFKYLTMGWRAGELMDASDAFYDEVEEQIGVKCYRKLSIRKIFASEDERRTWTTKCGRPPYCDYISTPAAPLGDTEGFRDALGSGIVHTARRLNLPVFLEGIRAWLISKEALMVGEVDTRSISPHADVVSIPVGTETVRAAHVVFCDGWAIKENHWFNYLPIIPVKGDVFKISTKLDLEDAVNRGCFVLHDHDDEFYAGSTFFWRYSSTEPDDEGYNDLSGRLDKLLSAPYKVISHRTGVRPTVSDRRPVLGTHPNHPRLHLFNGLGSKGVTLGPECANMMAAHLSSGKPIDPEVSLTRFLIEE